MRRVDMQVGGLNDGCIPYTLPCGSRLQDKAMKSTEIGIWL